MRHAFLRPSSAVLAAVLATSAVNGAELVVPPLIPSAAAPVITPLTVRGQDFVTADGAPVRFWGVNLCSVFPADAARAAGLAAALADRGINLVRPHHLLRQSRDWAPDLAGGGLALYRDDSRTLDPVALERFDTLNAALRAQGIRLMLSAHWTRSFLPGDAAIITADEADHAAWRAAISELRGWDWRKSFDPTKMLPVIDERAARVTEETLRTLLAHVNPRTGLSYAADPQVLSWECVNEHSAEYAIVCGNRFPAYFATRLQARWEAFALAAGAVPVDLWQPADKKVAAVRADFLRGLDAAWLRRLTAVIRAAGSNAPVTFSNLWRGEGQQRLAAEEGYTENHVYADPFVVAGADDLVRSLARCAVAGRPFIVGELNQSEGDRGKAEAGNRTMLPLAAAAYGALHGWSGITWFAWNHGDQQRTADDGWAVDEGRRPQLGGMVADGAMLDHLRTAGLLFRNGLVAPSRAPVTVQVGPAARFDYQGITGHPAEVRAGWQAVHAIRYAYGATEPTPPTTPWLAADAPTPLVSDTGEIRKDVARRQLTVAAPAAEAFSGLRDAAAPAGLRVLGLEGSGFATVILVAADGRPLADSASLVLSRTASAGGVETTAPAVRLAGLAAGRWWLHITRPRGVCDEQHLLAREADGTLRLPPGAWHEAELRRGPEAP